MIWSDSEVQKFSRNFVCVIDDVFYLKPSIAVKAKNLDSVRFFNTFTRTTPRGVWPTDTRTHQGLYVMTPECKYLAGRFASQTNTSARQILNDGWARWSSQPQVTTSPAVPLDYQPVFGGLPISKNRVKLRITYRDLPRGQIKRPSSGEFVNPYNMGWYDISKSELKTLFSKNNEAVLKKLALATLKDAVRGEMHTWSPNDWQGGSLTASWFRQEGQLAFYYLEGYASMKRQDTGLTYSPKLFGFVGYDFAKQEFRDLQLVATGQRIGKGPSNGRSTDLGPAPLGVAIRMYHPGQ